MFASRRLLDDWNFLQPRILLTATHISWPRVVPINGTRLEQYPIWVAWQPRKVNIRQGEASTCFPCKMLLVEASSDTAVLPTAQHRLRQGDAERRSRDIESISVTSERKPMHQRAFPALSAGRTESSDGTCRGWSGAVRRPHTVPDKSVGCVDQTNDPSGSSPTGVRSASPPGTRIRPWPRQSPSSRSDGRSRYKLTQWASGFVERTLSSPQCLGSERI